MNKKFKTLKNRILLLTYTLIFFTAVSIGLSVFYQNSKNNLRGIILAIKNVERGIILLRNTEQDILLNFSDASDFFTSNIPGLKMNSVQHIIILKQ